MFDKFLTFVIGFCLILFVIAWKPIPALVAGIGFFVLIWVFLAKKKARGKPLPDPGKNPPESENKF